MVGLDFLKKIEVFGGLNDDQLSSIQACSTEEKFHQDEKLFSEKEKASCLWLVKEGRVDLKFELPGGRTTDRNTVSTISEKMIIGWSSFVPPYKYTLSAYCASRTCNVVKVDTLSLRDLFDKDPKIGYLILSYMLRIIGSRFQSLEQSPMMAPFRKTKIVVHMGTCGIAAGARGVMSVLMDEINNSGRKDIKVESSGCIGTCQNEPNITVAISGERPVVYKNMNDEKIRLVFNKHILMGEVQTDYVQQD
ncbi:MAG: cyclic nucleotide-binding domain-containing protein [Deltaproteobacteria bacterium]|nr:cyclic nucleotide-binding domain-containing protein [Deltaproteobacteria bacterium]